MLFYRLFLMGLAVVLAGCQTGTVTLPRLPAWTPPANPAPVSQSQVRSELASVLPGVPVFCSDSVYTAVNHEWLEEFIRWTWNAQMALGFKYRANSRDCDKFAIGAFLAATDAAANAGVEATPLVARIVVSQEHAFAGVPGGTPSRHELNGIYTDRAPHYFVLEPQPNGTGAPRLVALDGYPNPIIAVILGDYNP